MKNAEGVTIVSSNCLTCHAAEIEGELIRRPRQRVRRFHRKIPAASCCNRAISFRGDAETRAWERWADRVDGIAPYIRTATVGVNPATNLTWAAQWPTATPRRWNGPPSP